MDVRFHTNLDLSNAEEWPTRLPCRPMVGDYISSKYRWPDGSILQLTVHSVELLEDSIRVELHLPPRRFETLRRFYDWYEKVTGRTFL